MENVEAIFMDLSRMKEIQFNSQVWAEMMKLRLLQIICNDDEEFMKMESTVHFPEDFEFPSYKLSSLGKISFQIIALKFLWREPG